MSLEVSGSIHSISPTKEVDLKDGKKLLKREFILNVPDGAYTQYLQMELMGDNCKKLDDLKQADAVLVKYNLRGRLYTNRDNIEKAFNSLLAWFIKKEDSNVIVKQQEDGSPSGGGNNDDDLPF